MTTNHAHRMTDAERAALNDRLRQPAEPRVSPWVRRALEGQLPLGSPVRRADPPGGIGRRLARAAG